MDAVKVLERPYVWDGLKRALRSRKLDLSSLEREVSLSGTISLAPGLSLRCENHPVWRS